MLQSVDSSQPVNIVVRTDVDDLRGPGSAMTEAIPGPSPFPLFSDSPYDSRSHQSEWVVEEEVIPSGSAQEQDLHDSDDEEDAQDQSFHLVVVGGDLAALSTALSVANSHPGANVTLTNVGMSNRPELINDVESASLGTSHASLLTEHSIRRVRKLLNDMPFQEISGTDATDTSENAASNLLRRLKSETIQIDTVSLRKFDDNDELVNENLSSEVPPDIRRPLSVIRSDVLHGILFDACTSHPRVELRSRAVVSALHTSTTRAPLSQGDRREVAGSSRSNNESGDDYDVLHGLGRMARLAASAHPRRSFIYLNNDEGGQSTSTINLLDKLTTDLDRSLRVESPVVDGGSPLQERPSPNQDSPVSLKDMQFDRRRPQAIKNSGAMPQTSPVVVLTSGEMIVADAVLGSTSAPSKVIDFVNSSSRNRWRATSSSTAFWADPQHGYEVYRAHVILDEQMADIDLQQLAATSNVTIWTNTDTQLVLSPLDGRKAFEVCVWHRLNDTASADLFELGEDAAQQLRQLVDGWCHQVVKLASQISEASHTLVFEHPLIDARSNESHNVLLIGDAAHSLLPYGHVWTTTVFDDAEMLGSLFSTLPLSSTENGNAVDSRATGVSDVIQRYINLSLPRHESLQETLGGGLFGSDIISSVYSRIIWSHVGFPSGQVSENEA